MGPQEEAKALKIKVGAITLLLVAILTVPLLNSIHSANQSFLRAEQATLNNRAAALLASAISAQTRYRGLGASYLASADTDLKPLLEKTAYEARQREIQTDAFFQDGGIITLPEEDIALWRSAITQWHAQADALQTDELSVAQWLNTANRAIRAEEHLIRQLLAPESNEMLLELLAEIESDALGIIDHVGLERAKLSVAIRRAEPLTIEELIELENDRGISVGYANILRETAALKQVPEEVHESLQTFEQLFFGDFEAVRQQIYNASIARQPYPVTFDTWWDTASRVVDAATTVSHSASAARITLLQNLQTQARNSLWQTTVFSFVVILLFAGTTVWLLKNLLTRIYALNEARKQLTRNRDDLEVLCTLRTAEVTAILQTAVNGIVSIDESGIIRFINPSALKMFGYREEEIVGKNVNMLIPPGQDHDAHTRYLQRYVQTGNAKIIGKAREVEAFRRDGTTFPMHLAVGHAEPYEGKHLFVAFVTDVTEQKNAELELLRSKEEAEAANRTKAAFLANMSHEIRTPMNAIIGFLEIVLRKNLDAESRGHLEIALNSALSLLGIINDILDLSKIEAGKISLESIPFNLPNLTKGVMSTLEHRAKEKAIDLILHYDGELPHCFVGDPTRLRQVLMNLVGNAIKFTQHGKVELSIKRPNDGEDMLHFAVRDTGVGMSQDQIERIFQPFTQADESTVRRFGGTGLGTSISRQIVEIMEGKIWVESELGKGSVFHFNIHMPLATCFDECIIDGHTEAAPSLSSPRRFRILVAEDIPENALLARLRLTEQGHEVICVENGLQVIEAFRNDDFDLILMDVQMPELDGMEATRRIRQLGGKLPIIALTASVMNSERERCFSAGMDSIQGKPINFAELFTEMDKLVSNDRGIRNNEISIDIHHGEKMDLSVIENIADVERALAVWGNAHIYADALHSFVDVQVEKGKSIKPLIAANDLEKARTIAHAIKGVSGNLSLIDIARIAIELDSALKEKDLEKAVNLCPSLEQAMQVAAQAIAGLSLHDGSDKQRLPFDRAAITELLQQLLNDLDKDDPSAVDPVIEQLSSYISDEQLDPIRTSINNFDFREAESKTRSLAKELSIETESERAEENSYR